MNKEDFDHWCHTALLCTEHDLEGDKHLVSPLIMGILNVTPNSFSDGGHYASLSLAKDRAMAMIAEGVDIIDIGGESSHPGVEPISDEEELSRILPVIESIRETSDIFISVDTYKPSVMRAAVNAGASMINDITGLRAPDALAVVSELNIPVCLMHMQGLPKTMQQNPSYPKGVVPEINDFFSERIKACAASGIKRHHMILDPGFGFGKTDRDNIELLKNFSAFKQHQLPLMLGVSRKRTLGVILNQIEPLNRLVGSVTAGLFALIAGANILRVHDVRETRQMVTVLNAIRGCE